MKESVFFELGLFLILLLIWYLSLLSEKNLGDCFDKFLGLIVFESFFLLKKLSLLFLISFKLTSFVFVIFKVDEFILLKKSFLLILSIWVNFKGDNTLSSSEKIWFTSEISDSHFFGAM